MLDPGARRLTRDGERVSMAERHFAVLLAFVRQPHATLSKDALIAAGWSDVAVSDNSLEQAISVLRRLLGETPDGGSYVQTVARQGYRFVADVVQTLPRTDDTALDELLAPHRSWLDGVAALETLDRDRLTAADRAFRYAVASAPDYAPAHLGLANAQVLRFESTRAHDAPAFEALADALSHAREACRLDAQLAEAWATLGFVLHRSGHGHDAIAAARHAVALEPDNWRHYLRLALVSWGEERLRAADRARKLLPGLALAHWLAATVYVARQAFDAAERELEAGTTAEDQSSAAPRFSAVGLHWLRGLIRLQRGDESGAREALARELSAGPPRHVYADECRANTWYAIAAVAFMCGHREEGVHACGEALRHIGSHPGALAVLTALAPAEQRADLERQLQIRIDALRTRAPADAALAAAIRERALGRAEDASRLVTDALATTPMIGSLWSLPVEPLVRPATDPAWSNALAILRRRAA